MYRLAPLILLAWSPSALATDITVPFTGERPHTFDLHAGFAWYGYGAAVGGRYKIPVVDNGFVPSIDNSVSITFGADLYFANYYAPNGDAYYGTGIGVPVTMAWDFWFTDEWSAFGEAGVNLYVGNGLFRGYGFGRFGSQWLVTAVGGRYHFNEKMALIGRLGSPYAAIGIEFTL